MSNLHNIRKKRSIDPEKDKANFVKPTRKR